MNVIINFITKNKEIFIFILLILSVLILFKYNLKEGHTDYINSDTECEADYTNEILEVMTKYLDINNKSWSKLIEINNKYVEFQDKMKEYGMNASHKKTCSPTGEAVLPIDVSEKYMKDAGDLLIGDGGIYELFVEHSKLFDQLKQYKSGGQYKTNVIVDSNDYDSNICDDDGFCQRAAWRNIEGSYDADNGFVPRVTFDTLEKIGDPEEYNGNTNYIKTYVYQVCSVAEYIVGEIWKHCADSICIQMTTECDSRINNLTNKWTFDKTKICRNSINSKCPGAENAFMSYIGYPNPGLATQLQTPEYLGVPTPDCPDIETKQELRDCYWGKISNENAYRKTGDNLHYTKENDRYWYLVKEVTEMPSRISKKKAQIDSDREAGEKAVEAARLSAAERLENTIDNCNTYKISITGSSQNLIVEQGRSSCEKKYDADGKCTYGSHKKKEGKKGEFEVTCTKSAYQNQEEEGMMNPN